MDLVLFTSTFCIGTFIGLTLKKNGVFVMPALKVGIANRQYFENLEKEMSKH